MKLGEVLTALRKEKKIGQKELAIYLNLSTGTISNYENGVHFPDLHTLCKLADYFDVTTDYLMGRTEYRYTSQKMNQQLNKEYTLSDVVDTVLTCNSGSIDHLMEYAQFLKYKQDQNTPNNSKRKSSK